MLNHRHLISVLAPIALLAAACGEDDMTSLPDAAPADAAPADAAVEDFEAVAADFECIRNWSKVQRFYITNKLGYQAEAEAAANSPTGGTYPVGTIIQLIPDEAMVKRRAGWSPETNDWEFFSLNVAADGATIAARGTKDVVNKFDGNCFDCHKAAAPQWDFVCAQDHGCMPIPVTLEQIEMAQNADPRCAQ